MLPVTSKNPPFTTPSPSAGLVTVTSSTVFGGFAVDTETTPIEKNRTRTTNIAVAEFLFTRIDLYAF
jgi:hypothetical protein